MAWILVNLIVARSDLKEEERRRLIESIELRQLDEGEPK